MCSLGSKNTRSIAVPGTSTSQFTDGGLATGQNTRRSIVCLEPLADPVANSGESVDTHQNRERTDNDRHVVIIDRRTKVIPVFYEACDRPTLLQSLRYVDCSQHHPDRFESQFLEIIDTLNEIDLNP